jgi:hypothetical protein
MVYGVKAGDQHLRSTFPIPLIRMAMLLKLAKPPRA